MAVWVLDRRLRDSRFSEWHGTDMNSYDLACHRCVYLVISSCHRCVYVIHPDIRDIYSNNIIFDLTSSAVFQCRRQPWRSCKLCKRRNRGRLLPKKERQFFWQRMRNRESEWIPFGNTPWNLTHKKYSFRILSCDVSSCNQFGGSLPCLRNKW